MIRNQGFRGGAVALGLCLALAGCHSARLFSAGEQGKLTPAQTADVQVAYGRSLEKRGLSEQAAKVYQEAIKKDPSQSEAYVRLAIMKDQKGQFVESAELYRKALKAKPGSSDIFCCMGYSLYLQHRWAEAEMNLSQAIALDSDNRRAHNNLGLVLAQTERPKDALDEFRKGGCNEVDANSNVAFALTLARRWPEARTYYERTLAADPQAVTAQRGLQELDSLMAKTSPPRQNSPPKPPFVLEGSASEPAGAAMTADQSLSPFCTTASSQSAFFLPAVLKKEGPEVTSVPPEKTESKHPQVPVWEKPDKPIESAKTDFQPKTLAPLEKVRYQQASKTEQGLKTALALGAGPDSRSAEPYVTQGTIMIAETAPPPTSQSKLKQRIADSCAISGDKLELNFTSDSGLEIQVQASNQGEANILAQRILQLPELRPYRVNIKVKIRR